MQTKIDKFKIFRNVALGLILFVVLTEAVVRLSGITDFPIYATGNGMGYLPKPNQSGDFLDKNDWVFNDRSMGTENKWNPQKRPNILLIGNSVVMGGNHYAQKDKLGPLIQYYIGKGYSVWPIAAGGWSDVNETVYLEKNPDVVKAANFFIWLYMNGGLSKLNQWHGEYIWPTKKPIWATGYVLCKYVLPHFIDFDMNELPPKGEAEERNLANYETEISKLSAATGRKTPGILFIYPGKSEFIDAKKGIEWLPERKTIEKIAFVHGLKIVDISSRPEWNESLYRDGTHPNVEGNEILAKILVSAVNDALVINNKAKKF